MHIVTRTAMISMKKNMWRLVKQYIERNKRINTKIRVKFMMIKKSNRKSHRSNSSSNNIKFTKKSKNNSQQLNNLNSRFLRENLRLRRLNKRSLVVIVHPIEKLK